MSQAAAPNDENNDDGDARRSRRPGVPAAASGKAPRAAAWAASSCWPGRVRLPVPLLLHVHRLAADRSRTPRWPGRSRTRRTHRRELHRASTTRVDLLQGLLNSGIFTGGVICCAPWSSACWWATPWPGCTSAARASLFAHDAAGADHPVPAADHPALRDDRARLRPGRHLPRHDPAVRDQLHGRVRVPAVLPAAARRRCSRRPGSTAPSELRILWSIALPLVRPAICHRDPADLHRAVERVPVAVPGHQGRGHAAARRVAGQLHHQRRRPRPPTRSARSSPAPACSPHPPSRCSSSSSVSSFPPISDPA